MHKPSGINKFSVMELSDSVLLAPYKDSATGSVWTGQFMMLNVGKYSLMFLSNNLVIPSDKENSHASLAATPRIPVL